MAKSPDAFRTISEVAEWLDRPAHVLRFWESKFTQIKPVKRAGGRRYYRPQDMLLLGGIKKLLHDDGMTIKGVQKLLRENGVQHVAALSQPLDGDEAVEAVAAPAPQPEAAPATAPESETADNLVAFKRPESEPAPAQPEAAAEPEQASLFEFAPAATAPAEEPVEEASAAPPEAETAPEVAAEPEIVSEPETAAEPAPEQETAPEEQVSAESEEPPEAAQAPEASAPGILSRILTRQAKLPGADLAPILHRVRSHADALGKASGKQ